MKIFKGKDIKTRNLQLSDDLESHIISLNKKYPRLKEVTEKYFNDDSEIDFQSIEKAFVSDSDQSMLMEKYKAFVKEYLETIEYVYKKYSVVDYNKLTKEVKPEEGTIDETIYKIVNTLENLSKLYLTDEKKEILSLIVESQDKHIDKKTREKKIKEAEKKWDALKEKFDSNKYILPRSLGKDLKALHNLWLSLEGKTKINNKTFRIAAISVSSIIIILIGVAIWLTII